DYQHFHTALDGASDLAGDLAGGGSADLAACPTPGTQPVGAGCSVYTFAAGVPSNLSAIITRSDASIDSACGMLHVHLGASASHDLWVDNIDAVRVEERTSRGGSFNLSARVHGTLDQNQKFSGVYATDGNHRFVSVQTSADNNGLHDHDVVFTYGAP